MPRHFTMCWGMLQLGNKLNCWLVFLIPPPPIYAKLNARVGLFYLFRGPSCRQHCMYGGEGISHLQKAAVSLLPSGGIFDACFLESVCGTVDDEFVNVLESTEGSEIFGVESSAPARAPARAGENFQENRTVKKHIFDR